MVTSLREDKRALMDKCRRAEERVVDVQSVADTHRQAYTDAQRQCDEWAPLPARVVQLDEQLHTLNAQLDTCTAQLVHLDQAQATVHTQTQQITQLNEHLTRTQRQCDDATQRADATQVCTTVLLYIYRIQYAVDSIGHNTQHTHTRIGHITCGHAHTM